MNCSANEVLTTLTKAGIGAGLAHGPARDIAAAGRWLCLNGFDGVDAVLMALRSDAPFKAPEATPAGYLFADAVGGRVGLAAMDLLIAGPTSRPVTLTGVDAPMLILGLAGFAAETYGMAIEVGFKAGPATVSPSGLDMAGPTPEPGDTLRLTRVPDGDARPVGNRARLEIDVPDRIWAVALDLARRTYVPTSEQSRLRGAGAGIRDVD